MKTFLTSDLHFFHENVIKFCNRPYGSVEQMNYELIRNWNNVVGPEDHVWVLGDVSFGKKQETEDILVQLQGVKHLIQGNHDRKGRCQDLDWSRHFVQQHQYHLLRLGKVGKAVLCHFPLESWERGWYHFHGHWHTLAGDTSLHKWRRWDVGVDNNNYTPILFEDAMKRADAIPTVGFDNKYAQ